MCDDCQFPNRRPRVSELRECPFCGGKARIRHTVGYWGECLDDANCGANAGEQLTEPAAIAAWNTRAGEAELAALRARIEIAQSIIQEPFRDYLTEAEWNESKLERLAQAIWGEPVKDDLEASDD